MGANLRCTGDAGNSVCNEALRFSAVVQSKHFYFFVDEKDVLSSRFSQCLSRLWAIILDDAGNFSNLTVLITAGAGGTGFIGIELAKAWGAKHIATSTTGTDGFKFVKSVGATYVVDSRYDFLYFYFLSFCERANTWASGGASKRAKGIESARCSTIFVLKEVG